MPTLSADLTPEDEAHHARCPSCAKLYAEAAEKRSALVLKSWRTQIDGHLRDERDRR